VWNYQLASSFYSLSIRLYGKSVLPHLGKVFPGKDMQWKKLGNHGSSIPLLVTSGLSLFSSGGVPSWLENLQFFMINLSPWKSLRPNFLSFSLTFLKEKGAVQVGKYRNN